MTDAIILGRNIRNKRLERDLEQQELAKRIGVTPTTVCNYEKGARSPSRDTLFKIANVFSCSMDELCGRKFKN